ncbi:MAG TPA: M1 family metallopeptidase [Gemmatimonadaceae bacterium]|nr:M1 family metallopeptidase [Gemmatimonadaceae bacterium]
MIATTWRMTWLRCLTTAALVAAAALPAVPARPAGAQAAGRPAASRAIARRAARPDAPTLYLPRAIRQAYAKGTRSPNGRPGPKYWQNHARYAITVDAAPPSRTIRGSEQITYWNESPDSLHRLAIKLFLNNHKPGAPRNGPADSLYLTSGVHVDRVTVNGAPFDWGNDARYFTVHGMTLPAALAPGDSIRLTFDWHYEISRESEREGMIDSTTYFLAYFYPRVAVYDDYNGWDTMPFTGSQEFYSDFNDYDVTVNVPANYVVWGTGTLGNPGSVLQSAVFERYKASHAADTTVHVVTKADLDAKRATAQKPVNSWHFSARDIPDVAFALSDHYDWDATSVVVDSATQRRATASAAFVDTSADYHRVAQYARHSLEWLSHNWPGIPYPYEKTTVVQGFAGMEYPMMANDETYKDTVFSRFVAEHEIAHTYMPFYMGINETRYAFMDEGWATTFEYLIGTADLGAARATDFFKQFRVSGWINDPSPVSDIPIITPEDVMSSGWGNNAYGKAALGYLAVKELLGDEMFRKCLHGYMDRWHGRHPIPWDFFNSFNDISGENLNWFWNAWYFENSYIDLGVRGVTRVRGGYDVTLDNIGGMPAPVTVKLGYSDGTSDTVHETPAIWRANLQRATVRIATKKTLRSLRLDGGIWMDADSTNDSWKSR